MSKLIQKRYRVLALIIMILILGTATYGFAATNTMADAGKSGEGQNTISGYTVTNVSYTLNSTDPAELDEVAFTLDTAASSVYAGMDDGAVQWSPCSTLNGTDFTCDLTSNTVTTAGAATLHVAAGQ